APTRGGGGGRSMAGEGFPGGRNLGAGGAIARHDGALERSALAAPRGVDADRFEEREVLAVDLEDRLLRRQRQLSALRGDLLRVLLLAVDEQVERVALVTQLTPRAVHVAGVGDRLVQRPAKLRQHLLQS